MRKVLFAILVITSSVAVHAQKTYGGALFLKIGYSYTPRIDKVISKIEGAKTSGLTKHFVLVGGEGYYRTGKAIVSLDYCIGANGSNPFIDADVQPFTGAGHLKFGWIIKQRKKYWIYPSIGSGTALVTLTTYDIVYSASSLKYVDKTLLSPSFDLGINADFRIKAEEDNELSGGLVIGFRLGYRASFRSSYWKEDHRRKLSYMPSYGNNAFYVTIAFGEGIFVRK